MPAASDDAELARLYNCSATALNILYEAALSGSGAAREKLRSLADSLIEAAGLYGGEIKRRHAA